MSKKFKGFLDEDELQISIPESFFAQYLPKTESINELKICLYLFWHHEKIISEFNGLTLEEIIADQVLSDGFSIDSVKAKKLIVEALKFAIDKKAIIKQEFVKNDIIKTYYFINNLKGIKSAQVLQAGTWDPESQPSFPHHLVMVAPNIYKLYEGNIGSITPMLSESLAEAENNFPPEWISEAFKIAVENNVRKWKYIEAILTRWKEEGRDDRTNQTDAESRRKKYTQGGEADIVES